MLKTACIHPEIMRLVSLCGHGDKILIADGNYPLDSKSGSAAKVYLGLTSGIPEVTQVLEVLSEVVNFEKAEVMVPTGEQPPIFAEFQNILGGMDLGGLERQEFYDACCKPNVRLAIFTGEKRTFANILLTIGVA
ncbi:RbsD/FucU family protein [Caproiciproducens faecalis]|uniref:RbsD/FucU family protein n=1 Tax=Caproiciproducens faecalis TaxID=2820301 RepID=A0ABS7DLY3_9FIRM|nr:RbsD/FucU family protein [Caproiciproducens faecalis]MBW7572323.1 RbsD/FucU family protein [Caproiciproducens faecalis]